LYQGTDFSRAPQDWTLETAIKGKGLKGRANTALGNAQGLVGLPGDQALKGRAACASSDPS